MISALRGVAERRYGKEAAPAILEAWKTFSRAFEEFPYGVAIYTIPTQHGPANPLRLHPTGYKASMMLFPYDDYKAWAGPYPLEIVEKQFEKMAMMWEPGLASFREALLRVPAHKQAAAQKDLRYRRDLSSALSERRESDSLLLRCAPSGNQRTPGPSSSCAALMIKIAEDEIRSGAPPVRHLPAGFRHRLRGFQPVLLPPTGSGRKGS